MFTDWLIAGILLLNITVVLWFARQSYKLSVLFWHDRDKISLAILLFFVAMLVDRGFLIYGSPITFGPGRVLFPALNPEAAPILLTRIGCLIILNLSMLFYDIIFWRTK